ncbi:MAG: ParM/StbA family protein [Sulfobacillus sp.]
MWINDEPWLVGKSAQNTPEMVMPSDHNRLIDPQVQALLAQALFQLQVYGPIILATGLPLGRFGVEKEAAITALQGQTWVLRQDDLVRTVIIEQVHLYPQGIAALFATMKAARDAKRWPLTGLVAMVDVGYRTMDVVVMDTETLKTVDTLTHSFDVGIGDLVQRITQGIEDKTGELIDSAMALSALRTHEISMYGEIVDVTNVLVEATDNWGNQLATKLTQWWRERLKDIRLLMTAGGGSDAFNQAMSTRFKGCWSPEQPLFANAKGYYLLTRNLMASANRSVTSAR